MDTPNPSPELQAGQAEGTPSVTEGIMPEAPSQELGQAAPATPPQEPGQAQPSPQAPPEEPTFFDPANLPVELQPAYKNMQGRFTKGMTELKRAQEYLAQQQQLVNLAQAFHSNPNNPEVERYMAQFGYVRANQGQNGQPQQSYEPDSWESLLQKAAEMGEERAMQRVRQEFAPYVQATQAQKTREVEESLNKIDPNWREYEMEMAALVREHPTLVKHPDKLYRMAVPPEILESRAIQQALERMKKQGQHAAVQTGGSVPRSTPAKAKISNWEDAVADAQRRVKSGEV